MARLPAHAGRARGGGVAPLAPVEAVADPELHAAGADLLGGRLAPSGCEVTGRRGGEGVRADRPAGSRQEGEASNEQLGRHGHNKTGEDGVLKGVVVDDSCMRECKPVWVNENGVRDI